jgi:hypothetical protein
MVPLAEVEISTSKRWRLQRKWWDKLLRRGDAKPLAKVRPTRFLILCSEASLTGFEICLFVFKDRCECECSPGTGDATSDKAVFEGLLAQREVIERDFGGQLDWDFPNIGASFEGGYLRPEEAWDDLQCRQVDGMNRLIRALSPHLTGI